MKPEQKAIREMNLSQSPRVAATFDDANLLPSAGVKRRSQTGPGRPGVVPESSRDGIWGVVFGAVMGFAAPGPPFLGVGGWINPSPGRDHQLLAPAGYLRFPGPDQTVIVGPYQVDRTMRMPNAAQSVSSASSLHPRREPPTSSGRGVRTTPVDRRPLL